MPRTTYAAAPLAGAPLELDRQLASV